MARVALLVGRDPEHRYSLHRGYADAVWAVGATPIVIVPPVSVEGIDRYMEAVASCDALCATGGGDVDPALYGEDNQASKGVDSVRDAAEVAAVEASSASGKPVLGICRGIQLVTVAFGGTLHQDLPTAGYEGHWDEALQHEPIHGITADPGTVANSVLAGATRVNSVHHQGVRSAGPRLSATAWSEDGLVEAVEAPGVLGVQWHPERLFGTDDRHLAPFRWLIETRVA